MKIEARGKYAGVKVHLDGDEAQDFLDYFNANMKGASFKGEINILPKFALKLGEKITRLIKEVPNLLEDRTDEQVEEALQADLEKIEKQLAAKGEGKDWKKVK